MMSVSSCSRSKLAVAPLAVASTRYLIEGFAVREPAVGRAVGFGLKENFAPLPVCVLPRPLLALALLTVHLISGAAGGRPAAGARRGGAGTVASSGAVSVGVK